MTLSLENSRSTTVGQNLFTKIRGGPPLLWFSIVAMAALSVICVGLGIADDRLLAGVGVWDKPAKFFMSLAIQFATVSWALTYLPDLERQARSMRIVLAYMVTAGWLEMAYMIFRASRGEASHFNTSDVTAQILYSVMGVFAVSLTATAGYVGWRLWRHRRAGLWTEAAALGLLFGAILGTIAGGYMSAQTGHGVGGSASDASGLGFFSWSTSGGDLRVAHFVGLHAAQIIPLGALTGRRSLVYGAVALTTILTISTFVMATNGIPLFRA